MNSDLTFITNEKGETLLERFRKLIKDTRFFDVLVGDFFMSGFYGKIEGQSPKQKDIKPL